MIVLVSFIVLLRELVSTIFRMVHPYIAIHSFLHLFRTFLLLRVENVVTRMRKLAPRLA